MCEAFQGYNADVSVFSGASTSDRQFDLRDEPSALMVSTFRVTLEGAQTRPLVRGVDSLDTVKIHLVYLYLLNECLSLSDSHRREILRVQFGVVKDTPAETIVQANNEIDELLIRSVPSHIQKTIVIPALAEAFDYDLRGIPGFYFDIKKDCPLNWQINLHGFGVVRPYPDEYGYISGLYIYNTVSQKQPQLLTSRGLSLGTPAIDPQPSIDRSLVA